MPFNNNIKIAFLILIMLFSVQANRLFSQISVVDSAFKISIFTVNYGFGFPAGDLSERFGPSHQLGGSFMYKAKSGWNIEAEGNFIFKDKIKNPDAIVSEIATSQGFIIDMLGTYSNTMLTQRGFTAYVKFGKLIPIKKINPNSGILFQLGGGMMQHKIRIDVPNNNVPQLNGDYKKGYDHLCSGPALVEYIGLHFQGNNKRVNFKVGLESVQAFTKSNRIYYFNDMKYADEKRFDMLTSIKIGWMLPFYPKTKIQHFYY